MVKADVCLFLEGTYPYISGGVSNWTHQLLKNQKHLTFHLVCILPPDGSTKHRYEVPDNVLTIENIFLQELPEGVKRLPTNIRKELFESIELPLLHMQHKPSLENLEKILTAMEKMRHPLGSAMLMDSEDSWNMLLRMYRTTIGKGSFLNFFWSWRGLLGGFYSILLAKVPEADIYHSLCTGYAGLLLSKAHLGTKKPCLLTEHGIYTNERRIEITAADWLDDRKAMNLAIEKSNYHRDLKDYWIDTFTGYSTLCYQACTKIITLYEGNRNFQLEDGADLEKTEIIPNGIDINHYSTIERKPSAMPTIALIGRVVPIKDIKTFIRSVAFLKRKIPNIRALILGPTDEDVEYHEECMDLVIENNLQETLTFTGKVTIDDYLGEIDVLVLTSISEAQPLVILEAGALGIPSVATDVGACRDMIYGRSDEEPPLGQAGVISHLSDPKGISESIFRLLTDKKFYEECSQNIKMRVATYYRLDQQEKAYKELYAILKEKQWRELDLYCESC